MLTKESYSKTDAPIPNEINIPEAIPNEFDAPKPIPSTVKRPELPEIECEKDAVTGKCRNNLDRM